MPLVFNVLSAEPGEARNIGLGNGKQPFVWRTYWSLSSDGTRLILAKEEPRPAGQAMGSLTITTITMAGDSVGSETIELEREPVTNAHVVDVVDSLAGVYTLKGGVRVRGDRQMIRDSMVVPDFWPLISALTVGRDGSIWIRRAGSNRSTEAQYLAIRPDDGARFRVSLPASFRLMRASDTTLWGWSRDVDGLPVVERFRAATCD